MPASIIWNALTLSEWEQAFGTIRRSSLLQSYPYAQAIAPLQGLTPRWGRIAIGGAPAGLVQVFEARVFGNLFQGVILDRGPLWFDGFGTPENMRDFLAAFRAAYPRRWGRRLRFIPEIEDSLAAQSMLKEAGFRRKGEKVYETLHLDLTRSEDVLRRELKKRWRNALHQAEKSSLEVTWDWQGRDFPWLLEIYRKDKRARGYDGASPQLLASLGQSFGAQGRMLIGKAMLDNRPAAAILVLCHGCGATYQIGWNSVEGRDARAHHLLLWRALVELRHRGINDFDLGGMNEDSAAGVKAFKEGMGGAPVRLPGIYS